MKPYFKLIFAGYLFHACINSLYQDVIGQDRYIELAQNAWVSGYITVPLALVTMIYVFWLIDRAKTELGCV